MGIVDIREGTVSVRSAARNGHMTFSEMDISIVAIVSDIVLDGHVQVGYGFHSNGRYSQSGILRRRLIPRLMAADASQFLDESTGTQLDPVRAWSIMMANEKPGGHGDRAVAASALDMAFFDLASKSVGQPLWEWLSSRFGGGNAIRKVPVYATGGYYLPGKGLEAFKDEIQQLLGQGYTRIKIKIGGESLPDDLLRVQHSTLLSWETEGVLPLTRTLA